MRLLVPVLGLDEGMVSRVWQFEGLDLKTGA
jgi:hypothetical protein